MLLASGGAALAWRASGSTEEQTSRPAHPVTASAPASPSVTAAPLTNVPDPKVVGTAAPVATWTISAGSVPGVDPSLTTLALAEPDQASRPNVSDVAVVVASQPGDLGESAAQVLGVDRASGVVRWQRATAVATWHQCHVLGDGSRVACLSQSRPTSTTSVVVLDSATGAVAGEATLPGNMETVLAVEGDLVLVGPSQSQAIAPVTVSRWSPSAAQPMWTVSVDSPELLETEYYGSISANADSLVVSASALVAVLDPATGATRQTVLGSGGALPSTGYWVAEGDGPTSSLHAGDGTLVATLPGQPWSRAAGSTSPVLGVGPSAVDAVSYQPLWTVALPGAFHVAGAASTEATTVLWRTADASTSLAVTYMGVDNASGAVRWEHDGTWGGGARELGGALVLDDSSSVWALNLTDGTVAWSIDAPSPTGAPPVTDLFGDVLVVSGPSEPGGAIDAPVTVTGYRFPTEVASAS